MDHKMAGGAMETSGGWVFGWVVAPDGTRLRLGRWVVAPGRTPAPPTAARGTCLLVNGRSEFMEKYAEQAADWAARGWRVLSFDWRGQGLSGGGLSGGGPGAPGGTGRRGHIDDFAAYLADLDTLLPALLGGGAEAGAGEEAGPEPVICFAHSMGGHLMLRHALERPRATLPWRALILSAPMLAIDTGALPDTPAAILAGLACRLGLAGRYAPGQHDFDARDTTFAGNRLTSDPARFQVTADAVAAEPRLAVGGVTWGWLAAAGRSMARLRALTAARERPPLPILLLSAGADRVVRPQAHTRLARLWRQDGQGNGRDGAGAGDLRLATHPPALHELMMERDDLRRAVWADIDAALAAWEM